ncbi:C40 family peptidase [Kocuria flava]|uniref:C40 family peptidase n=1 Tax=Kocuria TaxID=57493 RepID=UPI000F6F4356|nr:C40 family peptidase [Kocuria rosea]VEH41196.1 Probable endopeptidase cgR_2070 precursor [Kocuria rosea]
MSLFKQNTARHRAETTSHLVRTTTIAATAGAALIGSIAPAQAYAEVPTDTATAYAAPASALTTYTSAASPAAIAPQTITTASDQVPAVPEQAASVATVSTQSSDITEITGASGIVGTAMQGAGSGYVWGGTAFGAWDCSGFTQWVYAQQGIDIPRTSQQQWAAGTPTTDPQPGDLVVQNGGAHIGIYLGGGKMISALNPTQGTFVHSVNAMPTVGYVTFR